MGITLEDTLPIGRRDAQAALAFPGLRQTSGSRPRTGIVGDGDCALARRFAEAGPVPALVAGAPA